LATGPQSAITSNRSNGTKSSIEAIGTHNGGVRISQLHFSRRRVSVPDKTRLACLVTDLSARGARIQPADPDDIEAMPERFELLLLKTGERHSARDCLARQYDMGLAFE
jgi:hypothetical protein